MRYTVAYCFLVWVLFFPLLIQGQVPTDPKIDSLLKVLATSKEDTTRVNLLLDIAGKYNRLDFEKGKEYADSARVLSQRLGFERGKGSALMSIGQSYYNGEAFEPALDYYLTALDIFMAQQNWEQIGHSYNAIANVHSSLSNAPMALENFEKSRSIFLAHNFKTQALYPSHNMASVYSDLGNNKKALEMYFSNLKIIEDEKINNPKLRAATLNNIGNTMREMGNCKEALPYLHESEQIKAGMNDKLGLGNAWNNIGGCLIKIGKLEEGEKYVRKALQLGIEIKRLTIQEESYAFLSELASTRGNYKQAMEYLTLSYELKDSIKVRTQTDRVNGMQRAFEVNKMQKMELEKAEMEANNKSLEKENAFRRNFTLALVAVLALLIGLTVVLLFAFNSRINKNRVLKEKNQQIEEQSISIQRSNAELRKQNERLEDLMREKDGLIGIVAHDLKAPLARSAGLANLISLSGELNDEQRSYLKMIEKVTDQGQNLIRDLLDLNTIEHQESRINISAINVAELISETTASFQGEAVKKNIQLETVLGSNQQDIRTDRPYLGRILDNLISNAIKFSPKGSNVIVESHLDSGEASITIRDQGPGFTQDDRKKLFKKFQKLSARPTGGESSTGLGLAITKALVEKLNGSIEVVSEPGKGASFIVRLPREWTPGPN